MALPNGSAWGRRCLIALPNGSAWAADACDHGTMPATMGPCLRPWDRGIMGPWDHAWWLLYARWEGALPRCQGVGGRHATCCDEVRRRGEAPMATATAATATAGPFGRVCWYRRTRGESANMGGVCSWSIREERAVYSHGSRSVTARRRRLRGSHGSTSHNQVAGATAHGTRLTVAGAHGVSIRFSLSRAAACWLGIYVLQ